MKLSAIFFLLAWLGISSTQATTLQVFPIWQALSLHGTDSDAQPEGFAEAIQANVMARPMVIQGAMPESLLDALVTPTRLPTLPKGVEYRIDEANLAVLCRIGISGVYEKNSLMVRIDLTQLKVPAKLSLTEEQVMRLVLLAIEKTLRGNNQNQIDPMKVGIRIVGTNENNASLADLEKNFVIGG